VIDATGFLCTKRQRPSARTACLLLPEGRQAGVSAAGLPPPGRTFAVDHELVLAAGEAAEFDTRVPQWFGSTGDHSAENPSMFGRRASGFTPGRGRFRTEVLRADPKAPDSTLRSGTVQLSNAGVATTRGDPTGEGRPPRFDPPDERTWPTQSVGVATRR